MLNCRGSWFLLDTCMWCRWNEQDTQGKVCWTLPGSDIGKRKVSSFRQPFFDLVKCHIIILVLILFLIFSFVLYTNLLIQLSVLSYTVKLSFLWDFLVLYLGPVWINLFEHIYRHKHFEAVWESLSKQLITCQ
jgi:hypothetical protein